MKQKRLVFLVIVVLLLALPTHAAQASGPDLSYVRFLAATFDGMDTVIYYAAWDILNQSAFWLPVGIEAYAPTYVSDYGDDLFMVSIAGLVGVGLDGRWNANANQEWHGNVILKFYSDGSYQGGVQGSPEFNMLIEESPLSIQAKLVFHPGMKIEGAALLESLNAPSQAKLFFPFAGGKNAVYGIAGVHGISGRRAAIDFLSYNDAANNMAPNALYASEAGTITYACFDDYQAGLKIQGSLNHIYYLHIFPMAKSYRVGHTVQVHEFLGNMQTGSFDDYCGGASQQSNRWHVHFVADFTNGGDLHIENWTLNMYTERFTYYEGTYRNPGQLIGPADWSGWSPPPPPPTPLPTLTPTPGPSPTPGAAPTATPRPPGPPGTTNMTNFWSFLLTGGISIRDNLLSFLPDHAAINLATTVLLYATIPLKIAFTFGLFKFTLPMILVLIVLPLELVRFFMSLYRLILKNLPAVG